MSEKNKRIMETFGKVIQQLSEEKKEYLLAWPAKESRQTASWGKRSGLVLLLR